MKYFSIISIIVSASLIGYFFVIGLPKLASVGEGVHGKFIPKKNLENRNQVTENAKKEEAYGLAKIPQTLRDSCNDYTITQKFNNSKESDIFLEKCLSGESTPPNIAPSSTSTVSTSDNQISNGDIKQKCEDFMTRARFNTQKEADAFLARCIASVN